jgi:hypothetical protein
MDLGCHNRENSKTTFEWDGANEWDEWDGNGTVPLKSFEINGLVEWDNGTRKRAVPFTFFVPLKSFRINGLWLKKGNGTNGTIRGTAVAPLLSSTLS